MKKRAIIPLFVVFPFLLGACDLLKLFTPVDQSSSTSYSDTSSEESTTSSGTSSSSSEESSSSSSSSEDSSSSSSSETTKRLTSFSVNSVKTNYYTGDIFQEAIQADMTLNFSDGSSENIDLTSEYVTTLSFTSFTSADDYECSYDAPVTRAGAYTGRFNVSVTYNGTKKTRNGVTVNATFASVFATKNDTATALSVTNNTLYIMGDIVSNKINLSLDITWQNHGHEFVEISEMDENLNIYLYKTTDLTVNKINDPLEAGDYKMVVALGEVNDEILFTVVEETGYIHLNSSDLTADMYYVDETNSPIVANPKILVIPINLPASNSSYITNWTTSKLNDLQDYYFGSDATSLVNYYKTMSYNQMVFSGMIANVYNEPSNDYSVENINESGKSTLYAMMERALDYTKTNNPSVDWSEYDQNNDGKFDNIHFLTNFKAETWAGNLWPHVSSANISGSHSSPGVATYSIGAINHMTSPITQIHEQGHIFGLLDYYDYTDGSKSNVNYVGGADMQSHNVFDWNSYSKLSAGLMDPYVVDGSLNDFEITINDAATSKDCIIVPANYSTWNGSAFDEYFLIELFSNKGINNSFWSNYQSRYGVSLGNGGIRLYHVDSRLFHLKISGYESYGLDGSEVTSLDKTTWGYYPQYVTIGPNNSSDYTAAGYGDSNPPACADMKQLALIQKGGVDTFGQNSVAMLQETDLFKTGDTFTFNNYKHFLSKSGATVTRMDNGETFPWTIEFEEVTPNYARIRFHK